MAAADLSTFLITGVSSGLGRAFAQGALQAGHRVIGTVRREEDADTFTALAPDRAHPLVLDVTDYPAIPVAVADAETHVGPIDVLVNNAGYGHEGVMEESSIDDLQRQFAANTGPRAGGTGSRSSAMIGKRSRPSPRLHSESGSFEERVRRRDPGWRDASLRPRSPRPGDRGAAGDGARGIPPVAVRGLAPGRPSPLRLPSPARNPSRS